MRISDWGSDVCSSDLLLRVDAGAEGVFLRRLGEAVHRLADKLRQLARILRGAVERAGRVVIAREDILAFVGAVERLLQLALAPRRLGTGVGEVRPAPSSLLYSPAAASRVHRDTPPPRAHEPTPPCEPP